MIDVKVSAETEIWKNIVGQENRYEVSNLGNVRSMDIRIDVPGLYVRHTKSRILKPELSNSGYLRVAFKETQGGKLVKHTIHRLVALGFIGNPLNLPCVNHIDGNKTNNCAANLEWITVSGNTKHAYDTGLLVAKGNRKGKTGDLNKTNVHVQQWGVSGEFIEEFESISLTKIKGFVPSCVSRCAQGKLKTHKGYIWKYPKPAEHIALFDKGAALS